MVSEIAAALSSLKLAADIAQTMINLRDAEMFQSKAIDLQRAILEAQSSALDARVAHAAQIDRISDLEAEVARLKTWGAEKQEYELKPVTHLGNVAYMLKPEARGSKPPHWLCPQCYEDGKKAIFQATGMRHERAMTYRCPGCQSHISSEYPPKWIDA